MLSEAFFYVLASNLERLDGQTALEQRGINPKYKGKDSWGFVPLSNVDHWYEMYMMLVEAVESERNHTLDGVLVSIESPPVALR